MDRYAVIGNPVGHSKSPRIHHAFAAQLGQDMSYSALRSPTNGFAEALSRFLRRGGRGVNVTVPFKQDALRAVDVTDALATAAGAVNTIVVGPDRRLYGHNTDGLGLVRDLRANLGCELNDARVLVVGAGGAVRGILLPLLDAGAREIQILNRTQANADALVAAFARQEVRSFVTNSPPFDIVLNASSAGLTGSSLELPPAMVDPRTLAYDLSYGAAAQLFCQWARMRGAHAVHDGLGMLVEQAAEAFLLWRGLRPDTRPVIDQLRQA